MIDAIDISAITDTTYINRFGNKLRLLENIKRINIFIGENNSGKSRLLRSLIKNDYAYVLSEDFLSETREKDVISNIIKIKNNISIFNTYATQYKIILPSTIDELTYVEQYSKICECIESLNIDIDVLSSNAKYSYDNIMHYIKEVYNCISRQPNIGLMKPINKYDVTYIPVLRGVENFNVYYSLTQNKDLDSISMTAMQRLALDEYKSNAKHIYLNKVRKAYDFKDSKVIFTAEDLYDEITGKLLGGRKR